MRNRHFQTLECAAENRFCTMFQQANTVRNVVAGAGKLTEEDAPESQLAHADSRVCCREVVLDDGQASAGISFGLRQLALQDLEQGNLVCQLSLARMIAVYANALI